MMMALVLFWYFKRNSPSIIRHNLDTQVWLEEILN